MPEVSKRFQDLYKDIYVDGAAREWRDVGAVDKARNVETIWRQAHFSGRPRVVEFGCGEGAVAAALATRGFFSTYLGLELSRSGVEEATRRNIPGARFLEIATDEAALPPDSGDLAVLSHVVEHLEHPRALIYDAMRVAPWVVVEVPLELNARMPRDYVWDDLGHINKYTRTSIRQLLQTCDLDVVAQMTTNPSRDLFLFHQDTWQRRLEWRVKDAALRIAPGAARAALTYHETLLARRKTAG